MANSGEITPDELNSVRQEQSSPTVSVSSIFSMERPDVSVDQVIIKLGLHLRDYSLTEFGYIEIGQLKRGIQLSLGWSHVRISINNIEVGLATSSSNGDGIDVPIQVIVERSEEDAVLNALRKSYSFISRDSRID